MKIANPIYGVVFKYLLDDSRIARTIISAIIGAEVVEIDLRPREYTTRVDKDDIKQKGKSNSPSFFTVYRLDFNARIRQKDGKLKLIIIEIQKAKLSTDILRFRKYPGEQYRNPENVYYQNGKKKCLPIINIYFLGKGLEKIKGIPVIRVHRSYYNLADGSEIHQREDWTKNRRNKQT